MAKLFRSISVSDEAHRQAKELVHWGLVESISQAFAWAMEEYYKKKVSTK